MTFFADGGGDTKRTSGRNPQLIDQNHTNGKLQDTLEAHLSQYTLPLLRYAGERMVRQRVVYPLGVSLKCKCYSSNGIRSGHISILNI